MTESPPGTDHSPVPAPAFEPLDWTYATSREATEIVSLMRRLNLERGLSFLIVTHDIAVGRKTDRILRMLDGVIVEEQILEVPDGLARHPV